MTSYKLDLNLYTEDFFKTIFHTATESWILSDKKGKIIMVNPMVREMFGYEQEELLGKKVEVLMPKENRKEHVPVREDYVKSPKKRPHGIGIEVEGLHKNNYKFPIEISLNYYKDEGEVYALAVVIDISKRKEKEKELQLALIENEKIKKEKVAYELKVLKNQINPHYFFNSLSVLAPLISIDQNKSKEFTEKLAYTYRYILKTRNKLTVTIQEELNFIKDYELLQTVRFTDKFIINYNIDKKDLNKNILPFSIQLLIENAFKHNALYKNKKLVINIMSKNNGVMVENNINEKINAKSKYQSFGIGHESINKQYEYMSNEKVIIDKENLFFRVWIPFIILQMDTSSNIPPI